MAGREKENGKKGENEKRKRVVGGKKNGPRRENVTWSGDKLKSLHENVWQRKKRARTEK